MALPNLRFFICGIVSIHTFPFKAWDETVHRRVWKVAVEAQISIPFYWQADAHYNTYLYNEIVDIVERVYQEIIFFFNMIFFLQGPVGPPLFEESDESVEEENWIVSDVSSEEEDNVSRPMNYSKLSESDASEESSEEELQEEEEAVHKEESDSENEDDTSLTKETILRRKIVLSESDEEKEGEGIHGAIKTSPNISPIFSTHRPQKRRRLQKCSSHFFFVL